MTNEHHKGLMKSHAHKGTTLFVRTPLAIREDRRRRPANCCVQPGRQHADPPDNEFIEDCSSEPLHIVQGWEGGSTNATRNKGLHVESTVYHKYSKKTSTINHDLCTGEKLLHARLHQKNMGSPQATQSSHVEKDRHRVGHVSWRRRPPNVVSDHAPHVIRHP